MSISLNELMAWSARMPDPSSEEARMLQAMIARRDSELRLRIADLISKISERENWRLHVCAATARRVEQTPADGLEAVYQFFVGRNEGTIRADIPAPESLPEPPVNTPVVVENVSRLSASTHAAPPSRVHGVAPIEHLYRHMSTLEASVAKTPGITCGVQGIRIMRMVALMSKARSAQLAKLRMSGTQAIYRHM